MAKELKEKNKSYVQSQELEAYANEVIKKKHMTIPANVAYVLVYPYIGKAVAGRCIRANSMTKLFGECDYIIQMSGDLWDRLDEERQEILMYHELLHILVTQDKKGNSVYKLRDHDVQDFEAIIRKYGIEWLSELKDLHASVYDLEPEALDNYRL